MTSNLTTTLATSHEHMAAIKTECKCTESNTLEGSRVPGVHRVICRANASSVCLWSTRSATLFELVTWVTLVALKMLSVTGECRLERGGGRRVDDVS